MVTSQEGAHHQTEFSVGVFPDARPISRSYLAAIFGVGDFLLTVLSGLLVHEIYVSGWTRFLSWEYLVATLAGGIAVVCALKLSGAYDRGSHFSVLPPVARLAMGLCIAFSLLLAVAFLAKMTNIYSRVWAISWLISLFFILTAFHALLQFRLRQLAALGRFAARTVILGADETGQRLARYLSDHGDPNVKLIGFVDDREKRTPASVDGLPVLGGTGALVEKVRRGLVDQVFVALPWAADSRLQAVVGALSVTPVRILLAPDLIGYHYLDRSFDQYSRLPVLQLYDRPISEGDFLLKEAEDRALSAFFLLLLAPLFAIIAIWIKLDSPGPVFFRQKRHGFNNMEFEVWKFRTMYIDRTDEDCEIQTTRDDERVTPAGRLLRKTSLDEFPQLLNVLLGSMSLVGPRPHALRTKAEGKLFEDVVERYAARHRVKPGITGWAQVNGWRGETDTIEKIRQRVEHDLYYIDNWSLWLDLSILARTALVILSGRNAY